MDDKQAISAASKELGLGALLPAVYKDLLSPAAKELGEGLVTLAKAVKISLAPIESAVWGYERIREWLSVRVTSLLAERGVQKVQQPPLSLAGPLIVQMMFASEESDLREMYARLLATSMDSTTTVVAHPSFVTVIQQLTPGEARILHHLANFTTMPFWSGNQESDDLRSAMRQMCAEAGIIDTAQADLYVSNFLRLRILRHVTSSDAEFHPEEENFFGEIVPTVSTSHSEWIELTRYGETLLRACVIDRVSERSNMQFS